MRKEGTDAGGHTADLDGAVASAGHGGEDSQGVFPHRSREELKRMMEVFLDLLLEKEN